MAKTSTVAFMKAIIVLVVQCRENCVNWKKSKYSKKYIF